MNSRAAQTAGSAANFAGFLETLAHGVIIGVAAFGYESSRFLDGVSGHRCEDGEGCHCHVTSDRPGCHVIGTKIDRGGRPSL